MPTTYTHYRFGQDVLEKLPPRIQNEIGEYMDEYNIGLHGPDILFYYHAFHKNKVNRYGVRIHNEPMEEFLKNAFAVYQNQGDPKRAFAYLAGMMTHFYLDSTCHPYIKKRIKETGISHTQIETELDAVLMQHDHLDPITHKTATHLTMKPATVCVIAPYFKMPFRCVFASIFFMRLILDHIFRSPWGVKRNLVILLNKLTKNKFGHEHYFVHKKRNMENKETIRELLHIYKKDVKPCAREIAGLRAALMAMDDSYREKPLFRNNFAG